MIITYGYVLLDLALFLLFYLFQKQALNNPYKVNSRRRTVAIICIVLFLLFAFYDPDYLGYRSYCIEKNPYDLAHLEDFYVNLIHFVNGNYILFRAVVWGGALLFFSLAVKRLKLNFDLAFLFLFAMEISKFGYGRFILGLSVAFFGLSLVVCPFSHKWLSIVLGFIVIGLSVFLHFSIAVEVFFILAALLSPNLSRIGIILLILFVPILLSVFFVYGKELLTFILETDYLSEEVNISTRYGKSLFTNLSAIIQHILEWTPFYLTVWLFVITHWNGESTNWPRSIKVLSNLSAITILGASIFALDLPGINTDIFFYRFLYFAIIPMCVFLSYCYENNIHRKFVKSIFTIGVIGSSYILFYRVYMSYIQPFVSQ